MLLGGPAVPWPPGRPAEGYDPKAVFAMLNSVKDRILCVHGNCDAEVDQMVLHFPIEADFQVEELCGRRLFPDPRPPFQCGSGPSRPCWTGRGMWSTATSTCP